jgi:glycosyltransferase involved in cell wall biosynthesis
MPRILFATTHVYLPQRAGGAEMSTHTLCTALAAVGVEAAVLARLEPEGLAYLRNRIAAKLLRQTCPVDHLNGYPTFRGWGTEAEYRYALDHFRPDAVVVVGAMPDPYALAAWFSRAGVPTFYQVRDAEFARHGGPLDRLKGVRFIANSRFVAARLRERFGLDSQVLHPPIRARDYRVERKGEAVVMINPDPAKGGEVATRLAESRRDIPFLFQESWAPTDAVLAFKQRALAGGNVTWQQPLKDMRPVYARARLLLVPSQWEEAWGRVVSEAQASGIPALASDIGGLPESVGSGGILVTPDAPLERWLAALSELWDDDAVWARYAAAAAAHFAALDLSPERSAQRLVDIVAGHSGA